MNTKRIPIKYNFIPKRQEEKFVINNGEINMLDDVYEFEATNNTTIVNKNNISLNTAISEMKKYYKNLENKDKINKKKLINNGEINMLDEEYKFDGSEYVTKGNIQNFNSAISELKNYFEGKN